MTISEILKEARPNLSEGSLKTYTSIIVNISKQMKLDLSTPEEVITNYEAILAHLQPLKPSIRKTKLACLIVFMSKTPNNEQAKKAFNELMMEDKTESDEQDAKQELTPRQEQGWLPWKEVLERYQTLEKDANRLWKKPSLDKSEFHRLQTYVLLSCLVLIPPRRSLDWVSFRLRNEDKEKDNYMTYEKRKPIMVMNDYKTKRTYGQQRVPIPTKLATIIRKWMDVNPHDSMLMNYNQKAPMNQTQLNVLLHEFFGKPISTSLLRHIYLTHVHEGTPAIKQMTETATTMAHSINEALLYVKKPVERLGADGNFE
jgi:integrase